MYYLGSTFMYYLLPTTYYLQMKMCYLGTPSSAATTENAYPRCWNLECRLLAQIAWYCCTAFKSASKVLTPMTAPLLQAWGVWCLFKWQLPKENSHKQWKFTPHITQGLRAKLVPGTVELPVNEKRSIKWESGSRLQVGLKPAPGESWWFKKSLCMKGSNVWVL